MQDTLQNIGLDISNMKKKYLSEGFEIVGIFGSYAKGNADKFSDIDIAYTLDFNTFDKQFKGGFSKIPRIEEIKNELQKLLHLKVDLVSINSSNKQFNQTILKDIFYV